MARTTIFSRRQIIIGAGSTAVALSLGDLMFPSGVLAATPKKGGKLSYAILVHNSKHKSLKTAKHPYKGIEIRESSPFDLQPRQGISWRPIQNDPAENLGRDVVNVILGFGDEGSAELIWLKTEGGSGTLVGRYTEVSSAGAFAHVLFEK